jgi:hypothetical protein
VRAGTVIERGALPDGREYRLWQCDRTGRRIVYIGGARGGRGRRRNVAWLRKTLKAWIAAGGQP